MRKANGVIYTVGAGESDTPTNGNGALVPFMQQELIPGIKNQYLVLGIGAIVLFGMVKK